MWVSEGEWGVKANAKVSGLSTWLNGRIMEDKFWGWREMGFHFGLDEFDMPLR